MKTKHMIERAKSITMRHEEKYICSEKYLKIIESRLQEVLCPDENQADEGYEIRSLYFDTATDSFFEEGLQGIENRDKFRIRAYNCNTDVIKLEKKSSMRALKKKKVEMLDRAYVESLLENDTLFNALNCEEGTLLEEFTLLRKTVLLKPRIVVNYNRKAFVNDIGNIRITLDRNIRATDKVDEFFERNAVMFPVLPEGINLLEVKYDGILPGYLVRLLNLDKLERTAFSKYVLSCDMMKNNGRMSGLYEF